MARTISQIQQSIIDTKNAQPVLNDLSSTSNVSVWMLWTYVVAVCQWVLEKLFDAHREEVSQLLAKQKPHTLQWYVSKVKEFQYGVALPAGSDTYLSISSDPAIAIISYAAAVELTNMIRIKVASGTVGSLAPITTAQLTATTAYMQQIKDAGVRIQLTSGNADNLKLTLKIYYDPLVLDATGARLDGTSVSPVKDAINLFLASLPFNGVFIVNKLIGALQQIDGVVIGHVISALANYASLPYTSIGIEYTPDAGYMKLDESFFDANVIYISYTSL